MSEETIGGWTLDEIRSFNRDGLWHANGKHTWHTFPDRVTVECQTCTVSKRSWTEWREICDNLTDEQRQKLWPEDG